MSGGSVTLDYSQYLSLSRWVVRDYRLKGNHLVPDGPEQKSYNPFEQYYGKSNEPPYRELANLKKENLEQVCAFVNKHGLLGLFQYNMVQSRYVPDSRGWVLPLHEPPFGYAEVVEGPGYRYVVEPQHAQYPDGWLEDELVNQGFHVSGHDKYGDPMWLEDESEIEHATEELLQEERENALRYWTGKGRSRGIVMVRGLAGFEEKSLMDYYCRFFPQLAGGWSPVLRNPKHPEVKVTDDGELRSAVSFPSIHSPEVWAHMCENVYEFGNEVRVFRDTLSLVRRLQNKTTSESERATLEQVLRQRFSHALAGVRPAFRAAASGAAERGKRTAAHRPFTDSWFYPSLLSAYYMMLYLDVIEGRLIRECPRCRELFVSDLEGKAYCSSDCQTYAKLKRSRKRQREKEKAQMAPNGVYYRRGKANSGTPKTPSRKPR
ncbi:MAG: hypothetical protein Q8Q12_17655 [bacterium]|nr:hypothetical protein [bacterium]